MGRPLRATTCGRNHSSRAGLLCIAMFVASGGAVSVGCGPDRDRRVRAPAEGIELRYAMEVGSSFDGHLRIGTTRTVEGLSAPLTQSIQCDARMFVVKVDESGAHVVRATFRNVELDWNVPPETGLSSDAFAKLAATALDENELRFSVSPRGKVISTASPSGRSPEELGGLLDTLGRATTLAFIEVPDRPIRVHEQWTDGAAFPGGRDNGVTLFGLSRRGKSGPLVAELGVRYSSAEQLETASGPRRRQIDGEQSLKLSERGVPLELHVELRDFDPVRGTAVQEIHATWTRTDSGDRGATDVQDIDDPCDADYVGRATCPD